LKDCKFVCSPKVYSGNFPISRSFGMTIETSWNFWPYSATSLTVIAGIKLLPVLSQLYQPYIQLLFSWNTNNMFHCHSLHCFLINSHYSHFNLCNYMQLLCRCCFLIYVAEIKPQICSTRVDYSFSLEMPWGPIFTGTFRVAGLFLFTTHSSTGFPIRVYCNNYCINGSRIDL
jgi:hypothetical protein